jgi:hypothetical protein
MKTPRAMQIRLEYIGTGNAPVCELTGTKHVWRVWREPRVCGSEWCPKRLKNVRTSGPQWAFDDGTGYVRYIGETWAVAVERLKGYVESYGMKLLQELN